MKQSRLLLIAVLLLAAFLRLVDLPHLPPGLNFDEAGNGAAALDILRGDLKIWWRIGGGKEPLWPYLIALGTVMLGNTPFTLRLPSALVGILSVAATYPLGVALFKTGKRGGERRQAQWLALLMTMGLTLSGWHLHFSRLGFRAILLPLFSALAFYFFWRGRHGLSALFLALAIYSYLAARLLPFVLIPFFALRWLTQRKNLPARSLSRLFAYLLLFLFPLMLYFSLHPADLTARSGTVSIFNPAWNKGDLAGTAWHTLVVTLGTFAGLAGDPNPLVNLPGEPAIPPLLAPFFLAGILTAARQINEKANMSLLLCWWGVMLLPAILAPEGAPHHLRLLGTIVPTYALLAVGLDGVARKVPKWGKWLPLLLYAVVAYQTYTHYFIHWPTVGDFTLPFDRYAVTLAAEIKAAPAKVAYVLPMDLRAGDEARHYTLDYLTGCVPQIREVKGECLPPYGDRTAPPYTYIPVDERIAGILLAEAAAGHTELRAVRWTDDKHREADAKEIITYLLAGAAHLDSRASFPVYDLEAYTLAATPTFTLPAIAQPVGANFEGLLRVEAAFIPTEAASSRQLPIALTFTPLGPMGVDYKASIRLVSPAGERVAQKDRLLMHAFHQGTSLWPAEAVNEYYLLDIPPNARPGLYTVTVVIYHPETQAPLLAGGQVEVATGQVSVTVK
jgi:hypothetical protein